MTGHLQVRCLGQTGESFAVGDRRRIPPADDSRTERQVQLI
ncbi:uncharacterized protein METZ01_LOCUS158963, partial [marine metagenome]